MLLSPMIRSVGPRGMELSPILPSPEEKSKNIIEDMQPKFSELVVRFPTFPPPIPPTPRV